MYLLTFSREFEEEEEEKDDDDVVSMLLKVIIGFNEPEGITIELERMGTFAGI